MNYDRLTTVEIKVRRKRRIRLIIYLLILAWIAYQIASSEYVLADTTAAVPVSFNSSSNSLPGAAGLLKGAAGASGLKLS